MYLDYSSQALTSRLKASTDLDQFRQQWTDSDVVIDLGQNLAITSWIDGFIVEATQLVRQAARSIAVLTEDAETREHLDYVLHRRRLAVIVAANLDAIAGGDVEFVGDLSQGSREALNSLLRIGETTVADLADDLNLTIEAAQQRLNGLIGMGLILRKKQGRAFTYGLSIPLVRPLVAT